MKTSRIITYFISFVWIINGLFCKIFNLVPRHQEIVSRILGSDNARVLTLLIGISEVLMALWIISSIEKRLNAILQIIIIMIMNIIEFIVVPDLLLWGKLNIVFAMIFVLIIYYHEYKVSIGVKLVK